MRTRGLGDSAPLLAAKAAGQVGERADGYVGARPGHEAAAQSLLADENARRRAEYEKIAAEHGTDLRAVQTVAGERRIGEAEPGEWILPADGVWRQKSAG